MEKLYLEALGLPLLLAFIVWFCNTVRRWVYALLIRVRTWRMRAYFSASAFNDEELSGFLRNYVRPKACEDDPANFTEPRDALSLRRVDLSSHVDKFLSDGRSKHLLVLADSGMGKTTFLIHYFYKNKSKWIKPRPLAFVSLAKRDAELSLDKVPRESRRSMVLLLDALDEDPQALEGVENRVSTILEKAEDFKAVIVTCRSQFFSSEAAIPVDTGVIRVGPTRPSESKRYHFQRIYIAPFDDAQIGEYLRRDFPGVFSIFKRHAAKQLVRGIPYLSVRPMLLAHIRDVMAIGVGRGSIVEIYQAMVNAWVQREHQWTNKEELLKFSRLLAFHMFVSHRERGEESCSPEELVTLAEKWGVKKIRPDHLTARSLLNRRADGHVKFSHRSIMEFFVAEALLSHPPGLNLEVTDQVVKFILQMLGCTNGRAESIVVRNRVTIRTTAPEVRLGYSTNFSLYNCSKDPLNVSGVYSVGIDSLSGQESEEMLGELVDTALAYANSRTRFLEVRLNTYPGPSGSNYLAGYLSVWFEDVAVLGKLLVKSTSLYSACPTARDGAGELVIVGHPTQLAAGASGISWRLATRFGVVAEGSGDGSTLTKSTRVSYFYSDRRPGVDLRLLSIGAEGDLAGFGILGGGSSFIVDRQKFARVYSREIPRQQVNKIIEQEEPLVPASERWFQDGRRKGR